MEEEGRWITTKYGAKVFIKNTSDYMNNLLKSGQTLKLNDMKSKGDERFQELKNMYPNAQIYEMGNGYEEIAIHDQDLIDEFDYNYETGTYKQRGRYNDTTQSELNSLPVSLNMRWRDDYNYQDHQSHYIYRNKTDLMKGIKQFGGLDDMTDHGRIYYSISSQSGIGEYYLVRDRFAKGGWKWEDANGMEVNGKEWMEIGKNRDRNFIKKYGQEEFDRLFKRGE